MKAETQAAPALDQARQNAQELNQEDRLRLTTLAEDLPRVWSHVATSIQLKKRLVRCALMSVAAERVEEPRIKLMLHSAGGVHTTVHVKRYRTGEHSRCTDQEVVQLMRELAARFDDRVIAQVLKKLSYTTGANNPFNLCRVQSLRNYHTIPCFEAAKRDWLTLECR